MFMYAASIYTLSSMRVMDRCENDKLRQFCTVILVTSQYTVHKSGNIISSSAGPFHYDLNPDPQISFLKYLTKPESD